VIDTLAAAGAGATLVSVGAMEWPDSCMGSGTAEEVCAQVITPGYNVTVYFGDTVESWHTDENGSIVRFANQQIVQN
jgi:predicted aldo/keto reductase-like oxidoreductase